MLDPVAFHLGPLTIRWYGICYALAFLTGYLLLQNRGRHSRIGLDRLADLTLTAMSSGVIGARLLYVAQNWSDFQATPLEIIRIDHGGLVFYGGLICAAAVIIYYCRRHRLNLGEVADLFALVLPPAHALGRIGCFINGCCFGRPWTGFPAVCYPPASDVTRIQQLQGIIPDGMTGGLPVFPVQLMESLVNLMIFAFLLILEPRLVRRGQLFALYLVFYAISRFGLEFLRGDYNGEFLFPTPAQILCLLLLPAGVLAYFYCHCRGQVKQSSDMMDKADVQRK